MRVREIRTGRVICEDVKNYAGESMVTAVIDTDVALTADSDAVVSSQKAVKAYVDAAQAAATAAGIAGSAVAPTKPIEAANAVAVVPNASAVLSTAGTTVLDLSGIADADEFNLISVAAQTMAIDFGEGVSVFAAGVAGTGARYVRFSNVVGTSCKVVRLSATSYYLTSFVGAVTINAAAS